MVIDVDVKGGVNGNESLKQLTGLPPTLTARTPSGGLHLYYLYPSGGLRCRVAVLPGIDVRADGGYVVAPGSIIGGVLYEWIDPEINIAALPEHILAILRGSTSPTPRQVSASPAGLIAPGNRNSSLTRLAGALRRSGADQIAIEEALLAENATKCTPPLPVSELHTIARSVSRYAPATRQAPAERFKPNVIAERLRETRDYITAPIDEAGMGVRLLIYKDGVFHPDGESEARRRIHLMLGEESKPERISSTIEMLKESTKTDSRLLDPRADELINVENGMSNWRTGELLPHSPNYRSTIQIHAAYRSGAKSEAIDQFLREVFPPDAQPLADEFLGYLLRPTTKYQKAFMLVGEGANGKSTFLSMLTELLSPRNVSNVALQDLVGNRFAAAELQWKLANIYADLPSSGLEESDVFKAVVAGDTIKVERKFGHPFKLRPTARLIFSANDLPRSRDLSNAYFRRWIIIPFPNTFEGAAAKKGLLSELCTDEARAALLLRAIKGLRRLEEQQEFSACPSVQAACQAYRTQCDSAYEFLTTAIERDQDFSLGKSKIYERYTEWCSSAGIHNPVSQRAFNKRLQEVFRVAEKRDTLGRRVWPGLRLRDDFERNTDDSPASPGFYDSKDEL